MHSGQRVTVGLAVVLAAMLVVLSGCKKKQPQVPQPQTQAPTISVPAAQPPATQPTQPQPQPQPTQPSTGPSSPAGATTATKPKPKTTHKKPTATAKKAAPATPKPPERKTVPNGGTENTGAGQLSASIPQGEAVHQRQTAAQLRINTEKNLVNLTRKLSDDDQLTVQQIRAFLSQSRSADNDGDTERAYTLALKAYLLSDDLVKR